MQIIELALQHTHLILRLINMTDIDSLFWKLYPCKIDSAVFNKKVKNIWWVLVKDISFLTPLLSSGSLCSDCEVMKLKTACFTQQRRVIFFLSYKRKYMCQ